MRRLPFFVLLAAAVSCAVDRAPPSSRDESAARTELDAMRARFPEAPLAKTTASYTAHPAKVTLPARADGDVVVEDTSSTVALAFRVEGAVSAARIDVDGVSLYAGAGIVHRVHEAGIDDSIAFATKPSHEEVRYSIDVSRAAGLRLVGDSLELLDAHGAPRLRMADPFVIEAGGARRAAHLTIEGCAYDTSPVGPWDRPVTPPGASRCVVRVDWTGVAYPALLDPAWTTTASSSGRDQHTAVKLTTGKVLFVYGQSCSGGCLPLGSPQLFDPATLTFAATGSTGDKASSVPGIAVAGGKALISGPSTYLYDSALGTFGATGAIACGGCALTLLASGKVLAAGSPSASLYDPGTGLVSATGAMHATRTSPATAVLPTGQVLVTGGGVASAEIYDPVANTFTATVGNMAASRQGHFAFTLPTGKVLVVGGGVATSELFDPATGMFVPSGAFLQSRTDFDAALLPSGNVLIVGGFIGVNSTTSTERYQISDGTFQVGPNLLVSRGYHRVTTLADGSLLASYGRNLSTGVGVSIGSIERLSTTAAGGVCSANDDCGSGSCDHGVCCATTCTSVCHACTAGTGACDAITSADDADTCTGTKTCDATSACKSKLGQACAAPTECVNDFCADGFCCDKACSGTCEACDGIVRGTCSAIPGPPHGARSCTGGGSTCAGACDGTKTDACIYPSATTGCGTTCSVDSRVARACDGNGTCVDQPARACPGNFVCADGATCKTSCATDADCASGFGCSAGACVPAAKCDGEHTIASSDGKSTTDCTPFKCDETNHCKTTCVNVTDCANPFVCDSTGTCAAAPSVPDASGCSIGQRGGARSSKGSSTGLGGLAFLFLLARRARRRRDSQNS